MSKKQYVKDKKNKVVKLFFNKSSFVDVEREVNVVFVKGEFSTPIRKRDIINDWKEDDFIMVSEGYFHKYLRGLYE